MLSKLNDPNTRKGIYYACMAIGAVLAGFGVGTVDTWAQLVDQLAQIMPSVLLMLSGLLAKGYVPDAPQHLEPVEGVLGHDVEGAAPDDVY